MNDFEDGMKFLGHSLDVLGDIVITIVILPFVSPLFALAWCVGFIKRKVVNG